MEQYALAELHIKQAEATKRGLEAAQIAANIDKTNVETAKAYIDLVNANFLEDDANLARELKFARLLGAHPEIVQRIAKVNDMMRQLSDRHGTWLEIEPSTSTSTNGGAPEDLPAVIRRNRSSTVEAIANSGVDKYDIPAFLRKQAD